MYFVYIFSFKSEIWHVVPSKGIETFLVVENRHLFNLFSIVCNFHRPFSCYFHVSQVKAVDESWELGLGGPPFAVELETKTELKVKKLLC